MELHAKLSVDRTLIGYFGYAAKQESSVQAPPRPDVSHQFIQWWEKYASSHEQIFLN